ncbi:MULTISPECIES: ABC transporter permease [unclassified Sphingomonas]|uniref:ABC transporter permease n=1 Tax=unclassified Sphingomonas TaxID=196159 RepID=UPI0006F8182E|nr:MULTISPECIES: ABC transporter permease [unclassified Sphingomonas]KQM23693.1 transporter [Sphingomonas sp. Leaf9]KQM41867.1 transporter [Sphingomonas sp. Leaf11]
MNRFALLSLYRSLVRHKLYAALNIGGLAVGIAVFLILGLYVRYETSYEKWLPDHDKVYVVQTVWTMPDSPADGAYATTMGGLLDQMHEDFPGVVGTRISGGQGAGSILMNGRATKVDAGQVDAAFFDVFPLPMVAGNAATALAQPGNVAIDQKTARAYFGTRDPIGQTLVVSMDKVRTYRVAAVFRDLPDNSDLKLSVLMPITQDMASRYWYHWGSASLSTFLRFDTPAAARAFEGKLTAFVDRRGKDLSDGSGKPSDFQHLQLLPLTDLHLEPQGQDSSSAKTTVVTLGLVGVLTLLIAVVNYVNLATARAGLRAREVAMRKVLGADRATLVRQFLGEAVLTVAIAALFGLILAELGLPLVNAAGGLSLTMPYAQVVPALAVLTVVVGMAAGVYPAILLSRFPAASVLASARSPGGGRAGARVREALVIGQFGLAIAFMIGTAVLVAQTRHVRAADLGFQRDGLLLVTSGTDPAVPAARKPAILAAIRALPQVKDATIANATPGGSGEGNNTNVPLPGVAGSGPSLTWVRVSPRFFETHGARLIAGRWFDDAHGADDITGRKDSDPANIVINRRALTPLRFALAQDAIGKTVGGDRPRTIIGVVDDLRFDTPRSPVSPTYYLYFRSPEAIETSVIAIRVSGDPRTALTAVRDLWQRMVPQVPFAGQTADERLADFYEADDRATRLFGIGAGLAVLIGCVGLWGLASFNTARRTREIGIRKTLGASSGDIVKLLVGQFLRPVLIANLVAWPLAFLAMRTWLAGFEDAIALSPLFFIGASVVAVAVAVLTVLGQSLRASRAAPAWALRHD